jgi:LysM repeat protein
MERRTSSTARIAAALALIAAVILVVVVASTAMNGSDSNDQHHKQHQGQKEKKKHRTKAKTYTVETGDTLTAISHKTGVPVAEILALNPEVDPQILIAGQTLKLK